MKIGVFATFMSPLATPQMIRDFGRRAEDIGLESIWMGEHVTLFDKNTYGYPGSKDGRIPVPPGGGMLDVVATFGFLAAATSNLRFGTGAPWTGCRRDALTSVSASVGTKRRSRPAAITFRIAAHAATSSSRSCASCGPSRWWILRGSG
jgi:hypothetical protein